MSPFTVNFNQIFKYETICKKYYKKIDNFEITMSWLLIAISIVGFILIIKKVIMGKYLFQSGHLSNI